jgi:hypothetical protein
MPVVVLDALRRFEVEARANVHEGFGVEGAARASLAPYSEDDDGWRFCSTALANWYCLPIEGDA